MLQPIKDSCRTKKFPKQAIIFLKENDPCQIESYKSK